MAKKRSPKAKGKKPMTTVTPNVIAIRGTEEWKDWLDRFADKMRQRPTSLIDLALAKLAEQEKFEEPPRRMKS